MFFKTTLPFLSVLFLTDFEDLFDDDDLQWKKPCDVGVCVCVFEHGRYHFTWRKMSTACERCCYVPSKVFVVIKLSVSNPAMLNQMSEFWESHTFQCWAKLWVWFCCCRVLVCSWWDCRFCGRTETPVGDRNYTHDTWNYKVWTGRGM